MKILIYGGKGWIGSAFCNYLQTQNINFVLSDTHIDSHDYFHVKQELQNVQPTHVMSFIGRTYGPGINNIDYLQDSNTLNINIRDNLYIPIMLALLCQQMNIHYTYLGTGCIFNYDNKQHPDPFTEQDWPNFQGSNYSLVKGYTDVLMHLLESGSSCTKTNAEANDAATCNTQNNECVGVLNLRIRMPITRDNHVRNFITKITQYEKICSIPNSMTVLDDFYPVWLTLMRRGETGTWNCTNPGVITHNEILEMYKEHVDPSFTWTNFTLEEQRCVLKADRSNNALDTRKLQAMFPGIPDIKTSVNTLFRKSSQNEPPVSV